MASNFLGFIYTGFILSILSGCVPSDGDPLTENMPPEAVNLPEPPTGYSALTSMDKGSTVIAINGQPTNDRNLIEASDKRGLSRVFLEPGYRCLSFSPIAPGGYFFKRVGCFDVLRSHKYRAVENSQNILPIIFDESTRRPVLARTLKGPEVEGAARLIWSNLDGPTRHPLSMSRGVALVGMSQEDTLLEADRKGSSTDQQVFEVKPGYHTYTLYSVESKGLLSNPIGKYQMVSFSISPGQNLRIVSGERGVYLLNANTNEVLRSPK